VRELARGDRVELAPGYLGIILWPEGNDLLRSGANDCSLVIWARGEGLPDAMLLGDLEAAGEERVLELARRELESAERATLVLKAGHHGSDTSSTPRFLAAVRPDIAVVSVGARNRYGHPGRRALGDLERTGCLVLRTDRGGAVRLELRGDVLWLHRPAARACALASLPVDAGANAP
jgi:competence protein ComEC